MKHSADQPWIGRTRAGVGLGFLPTEGSGWKLWDANGAGAMVMHYLSRCHPWLAGLERVAELAAYGSHVRLPAGRPVRSATSLNWRLTCISRRQRVSQAVSTVDAPREGDANGGGFCSRERPLPGMSVELLADDRRQNRYRACRIDAGRDLFGRWNARVMFGHLGCDGQTERPHFDGETAATAFARTSTGAGGSGISNRTPSRAADRRRS